MTALFKKLNFKYQKEIIVINNPQNFEQELLEISAFTKIITTVNNELNNDFILYFVKTPEDIAAFLQTIKTPITGDPIIWLCYPKQSSKKYSCSFNRDNGFTEFTKFNLESVRMVSIDEDFSAFRFRNSNHIKK